MSVMQRLNELATEEGTSSLPRFQSEEKPVRQDMADTEAMLMAQPIPGQSLTQNPDGRLPYEQPPKFTDLQEFIDETFMRFTDVDRMPDLLEAMRHGLPVEHVAEKYLKHSMQQGDITTDLLMLAIEPTIYMLISLATFAEIDPVLYAEDPMLDEEVNTEHTDFYKLAAKELLANPEDPEGEDDRLTVMDLQTPATVPQSLLARTEEAVNQMKGA